MKLIHRITIAAVTMLLLSISIAKAQPDDPQWKHQLEAEFGLSIPGGDFNNDAGMGYNVSLYYYYRFATPWFFQLSAGYYSLPVKSNSAYSNSMIPVLMGLRYNFTTHGVQPYLGLETGVYMLNSNVPGSTSQTAFGIAPKAGIRFPVADGYDFDVSAKWHDVFGVTDPISGATQTYTMLGLNIGFAYTLDYLSKATSK